MSSILCSRDVQMSATERTRMGTMGHSTASNRKRTIRLLSHNVVILFITVARCIFFLFSKGIAVLNFCTMWFLRELRSHERPSRNSLHTYGLINKGAVSSIYLKKSQRIDFGVIETHFSPSAYGMQPYRDA